MRAQEFIEELVRTVPWLEATAIVLKEKEVGTSGVNWHATSDLSRAIPRIDLTQ
jgi:hypothetical protein